MEPSLQASSYWLLFHTVYKDITNISDKVAKVIVAAWQHSEQYL